MRMRQGMDRLWWLAWIVLFVLISGCQSGENGDVNPVQEKEQGLTLLREPVKTVGSKDGTFQISVPESWTLEEKDYTYGSTRLVVNGNRYPVLLSIIQELQVDANEGMNLDTWEQELDAAFDDVLIKDSQTIETDGVKGKERYIYRQIDGGIKEYVMQTFLEKEGAFYLVQITGPELAFTNDKEDLQKLMSTFKVLKSAEKEVFDNSNSKKIVSKDQSLQITVPAKWSEFNTRYERIAELTLHDEDRYAQLIITRTFESDIKEGKAPQEIVDERFDSLQGIGNVEKTGYRYLTIDGQPAYQLEGYTDMKEEERWVMVTGLKKGNAYYIITITCPLSEYMSYKREYKRITDSFQVLKQVEKQKTSHLLGQEKSKVFEHKLPRMKIELTEGWKSLRLFDDGEIQAVHDGGDNTMFMSFAEDAAEFESVTMEDAYELYIESVALENPSWTEPEPIKIQGYEAIYFKGIGIGNGKKTMIITAITRSSRQFTQMIFTGEQDFMEANEDWFKKALTTYTETLE